jgi:hypothetical protein
MSIGEGNETNNVLLDEEYKLASQQEVKASIDGDVTARIKHESEHVEPEEPAELTSIARELDHKSVPEAVEIEPESGRDRARARRGKLC